ncbi:MAG: magnesium/cobalt transporter CorA [Nannocystaceae bacterium]|nr:magnesium/cobalt transporter CorA [bacterium]
MTPPSTTAEPAAPGFDAAAIPGSAVYTGPARDFEAFVRVFDWTAEDVREYDPATIAQAHAALEEGTTTWVDVVGVHDVPFVREVCQAFGVHPLTLEDIVQVAQRPKVEVYPQHTYIVLKMVHEVDGVLSLEQISLVVGAGFVLTFQETPDDVFEGVRLRLRNNMGRVRLRSHDYFAFALMDAVVDGYAGAVNSIGEAVEAAEIALDEDDPELVEGLPQRLHDHKRELMTLRKLSTPLRDAVSTMLHNEGKRIAKKNLPFYRDLHDHLVQVVDSAEMYREMIANLINLHMALVGQRTNEEMRVLTVIATIFIPLTFIVGVYGMNFDYMPELHQPWAYPALWVAMLGIAGALLLYFRRRGML